MSKIQIGLGLFGTNSKPPALPTGNNNISSFFMLFKFSQWILILCLYCVCIDA
jgi:hypothetical protein